MKIQTRSLIFLSVIFILFSIVVWIFSNNLIKTINEKWGEQYVKNQVLFDKYRTLLPILHEVTLVKQMAKEPVLIEMALHEKDSDIKQKGIALLEDYRLKFHDRSYFAAFTQSGHYYFNDALNSRVNNYLAYTLSPKQKDDKWFYKAIEQKDEYQVNVNKDTILGTTKVWINYLLRYEGKVIGVIGTGLTLDSFLEQSVGVQQEGIHNFFINEDLAIQLEKDQSMIDYASNTKNKNEHNSLKLLFNNPEDIKSIENLMSILKNTNDEKSIKTIWIKVDGEKKLIGIAYLKDIDWYSLTIINPNVLAITHKNTIFAALIFLLFLSLFFLHLFNKIIFITPLKQLKQTMENIKDGKSNINVPIVGSGEIKELSQQFKSMVEIIQKNNELLETKIKERTESLAQNKQMLDTILDNIHAFIFIKDTNYCYQYVNKSVAESFHLSQEEILGKDDSYFLSEAAFNVIRNNDSKVIKLGRKTEDEEIVTDKSGKITLAYATVKVPLFNNDGTVYALCGISIDITKQKVAEQEIKELAFYDTLTALPNRRLLMDRLEHAIIISKRSNMYGAVMFLDLDNFKSINDTYGHHAGDLMLIEASERIKNCLRESETVARFGGDEFVVLVSDIDLNKDNATNNAEIIAEKIREALVEPYKLQIEFNNEIIEIIHQSSGSIGISLFLGNTLSKDDILRFADQAMYKAKQSGRNQVKF